MNLKTTRHFLGLSLRAVAKATGINHNTIHRAENDAVDVGNRKVKAITDFYIRELAKKGQENG